MRTLESSDLQEEVLVFFRETPVRADQLMEVLCDVESCGGDNGVMSKHVSSKKQTRVYIGTKRQMIGLISSFLLFIVGLITVLVLLTVVVWF